MRFRNLSFSFLLILAALLPSALRAAPSDSQILRDCVNPLWLKMHGRDPADDQCVMAAKSLAGEALFRCDVRRGAKQALVAMIKFAAELAKIFGIPGDKAAKLFAIYLESENEEQFIQKLEEFLAGEAGSKIGKKLLGDGYFEGKVGSEAGKALYRRIRGKAPAWPPPPCTVQVGGGVCDAKMTLSLTQGAAEGPKEVRLEVEGDCHCKYLDRHGVTMGTFSVVATAPLEILGDPNIPCRLGQISYMVKTQCPCPVEDTGTTLPPPEGPRIGIQPIEQPQAEPTETPGETRRRKDEEIIGRICESARVDYESTKAQYEDAFIAASQGDRAATRRATELSKTLGEKKENYCRCLLRQYARAGIPLPDWVKRLCTPRVETQPPPRTMPIIPGGEPVPPAGAPADPCAAQREAYELARERMADAENQRRLGRAQIELASAHRDYCRCLQRTAPREVWERFCRWTGGTIPPDPPAFTPPGGEPPSPPAPGQPTEAATPTPTEPPGAAPATPTPTPTETPRPVPPPTQGACRPVGEKVYEVTVFMDPLGSMRYITEVSSPWRIFFEEESPGTLADELRYNLRIGGQPPIRGLLNVPTCTFKASWNAPAAGYPGRPWDLTLRWEPTKGTEGPSEGELKIEPRDNVPRDIVEYSLKELPRF